MALKYLVNSRGARYADFERSRLWISQPAELWLADENECLLLLSTSPAVSTFVSAHFGRLPGDRETVTVQIRAVLRASAMGVRAQLLNFGHMENPNMDEAFAVFSYERNGEQEEISEGVPCGGFCQVRFDVPKDFPKFLLRISYW